MSIPIILSTGSLFNFDVDTAMGLAAEAGYDGVELMIDWRRETYQQEHLQACLVDMFVTWHLYQLQGFVPQRLQVIACFVLARQPDSYSHFVLEPHSVFVVHSLGYSTEAGY